MALALGSCGPGGGTGGIGTTGGTVTTPDQKASLVIPAGTFASPVNISLEKIILPSPDPEQYTALSGGGFQINAPADFVANQDVMLEIDDSSLTTVSGQRLSLQALPADSVLVALVKRPSDSSYQMLNMTLASSKWSVYIEKAYFCYICKYLIALYTPTRVEINLPSQITEGTSVAASITLFNKYGDPLVYQPLAPSWSSDNTSLATVSATGLVQAKALGTTKIKVSNPLSGEKSITVTGKPVLFSANYNAGTIKGYSRSQTTSGGSPVPLVTITLPNGTKPNDIDFDPSGNLWVTDNANSRLLRFTSAQIAASGSPTPGVIISMATADKPVALTFDSSGNLWVTNESNRVLRYAASSLGASGAPQPERVLTQGMSFPAGVAVDSSSNLWVSMFDGNVVRRFTPTEQTNNSASSYSIGGLVKPTGLEFDPSGTLYVGQEGSPSGISVFASSLLGTANPSATRFIGNGATNKIYGLARDASNGTLWANNQGNGAAIAYTSAQLATASTTPSVTISSATEANIGYGGVAFANGGTAPAPALAINSFTATPNNLPSSGGTVTLNWNVANAVKLSVNQGVGVVTGSSTTRPVNSTTTFTLTAEDSGGNTVSSSLMITVNVVGRKVWHASFRENKIRGYSEAKWGTGTAANADMALSLAACGNAKPNDLVQDNAGNIIFTDNDSGAANNRVVRIAAAAVARGGAITAAECTQLDIGSGAYKEFIGLTLDTDGRSVFYGTSQGIRFLKYNLGTDSYALQNLPILTQAATISGVYLAANRLYAVDYGNFNYSNAVVWVYDLDPNRNNDATLRLKFRPSNTNFALPEGISLAAGRIWVANNSSDTLMGFAVADINAAPAGSTQALGFKTLSRADQSPASAFIHCPGALATAPNGELWVNSQGSGANGDCGDFNTAFGSVYKYTLANLNDPPTNPVATLQLSGIASVPGYGGLFFGR